MLDVAIPCGQACEEIRGRDVLLTSENLPQPDEESNSLSSAPRACREARPPREVALSNRRRA